MRNAQVARGMAFVTVLFIIASSSTTIARAADRDFKLIVDHIKRHYHTNPKSSFALGIAGLFVKVAHPAGVKSMKLAVFEGLGEVGSNDGEALDEVLRGGLSPTWRPVVKVSSRKDREQTRIFLRDSGDDFEMLLVTIDNDEATVLQAKVSPDTLGQWISQHDHDGGSWGTMGSIGNDHDSDNDHDDDSN